MNLEVENIWDSMKRAHYNRVLEELKKCIENAYNAHVALSVILDIVVNAVHAEAGTVWFYDRFGDDLIHPISFFGGADIEEYSLRLGEGIAGKVIETGESTIVLDCQKDARWAGKVDERTGFKTKTLICVPMYIDKVVFGSVQLVNKTDSLPFDPIDLEFAEKLAEEASNMLAEQELLKNYISYLGRMQGDTITFENIVCANQTLAMSRTLHQTNCYKILNMKEKKVVNDKMKEVYNIFDKALVRCNIREPKKGIWGFNI